MNYLTAAQVAERFNVQPDTVRRWINLKLLKAINISTGKRPTYRILAEDVDKLVWMPTVQREVVECSLMKRKDR